MTSRIRIPGLLDLLRIDEPAAIAAAADDSRLDREFVGMGPLLNRWIARRIRRALRTPSAPLPSVSARDYPHRADEQAKLEAELDRLVRMGAIARDHLGDLAAYVRGEHNESAMERTAQEAIGRLFVPEYRSSEQTWRAACVLDAAPRNVNPLRAIHWALTGAVGRSGRLLSTAVNGNPAGVHATGIAVHSLVRSLRAMRELWSEPGTKDRISPAVAAIRSLRAPESVPRCWSTAASTKWGNLPAGTLTLFQLESARARHPGADVTFMAKSWSHCPASHWTTALLDAVWKRASKSEIAS